MSGFQHLKVDGFRRMCGVDCELRPLTVMIGANGSGKTSLLEAMSLLAASADGRLADRISELGGISSVLLPFWDDIKRLSGTSRKAPPNPEAVPRPSHFLMKVFQKGSRRKSYAKPFHAAQILKGKDLAIAAAKCEQLRELLNILVELSGGAPVFK